VFFLVDAGERFVFRKKVQATPTRLRSLSMPALASRVPSGKRLHSYGKIHPFLMGKSTISMAIFNSYVSLPEGNHPRMAQNFPILICHVPKIHIFLFGGDWNHGFFDFPYIGNNDPN